MAPNPALLCTAALLLLQLAAPAAALRGVSNVSNVAPRVDAASGAILDIHDGQTLRVDDTFWWFGASYGGCVEQAGGCDSVDVGACGFNLNHSVSAAFSSDLLSWTFVPDVLAVSARPPGIMFSPWVAYSPATSKFVMWFNMLPVEGGKGVFDAAYYAVATSDSPAGPFETVRVNVSGVAFDKLPDAASVFVDDDGKAYLAFTHEDSHINNVQELTPDLLGPLPGGGVSAVIGAPGNEGILMFKREGLYYIGFGQCCCFCGSGTNVELFSAPAPLGPYSSLGNVIETAAWGAQTGTVFFTGKDYVLYGDRWQSAPDHIKAHDFSYMAPIQWGARPYIGGGEFAKAADSAMVFWVEGAPAKPTVKHMLDPYACEPCAGIDACGSAVAVSDAFLAALPTSAANFSCAMLPSTQGPLPLEHQDYVLINY
jgi:hypothetical protein